MRIEVISMKSKQSKKENERRITIEMLAHHYEELTNNHSFSTFLKRIEAIGYYINKLKKEM